MLSGLVVKAMQSADADQLIKFIFPSERLPSHTQVRALGTLLSEQLLLAAL